MDIYIWKVQVSHNRRRQTMESMESQMGQNSPGFHRRVIIKTPFS